MEESGTDETFTGTWPGLSTSPMPAYCGCPVLRAVCEGRVRRLLTGEGILFRSTPRDSETKSSPAHTYPRCKPASISVHDIGSIVPALAKNARTGHPQFRKGKKKKWGKGWATRPIKTQGPSTAVFFALIAQRTMLAQDDRFGGRGRDGDSPERSAEVLRLQRTQASG